MNLIKFIALYEVVGIIAMIVGFILLVVMIAGAIGNDAEKKREFDSRLSTITNGEAWTAKDTIVTIFLWPMVIASTIHTLGTILDEMEQGENH